MSTGVWYHLAQHGMKRFNKEVLEPRTDAKKSHNVTQRFAVVAINGGNGGQKREGV